MAQTEMRTAIKRHGLTLEIVSGPTEARDADGWEHYSYELRLHSEANGATLDTPWRAGLAHDPNNVKLADVLYSIVSDTSYADYDFEEFASELGYDPDSRKAYAQWEAVQDQARRFHEWCYSQAMIDDLTEAAEGF